MTEPLSRMSKPLFVGNWKMNLSGAEASIFCNAFLDSAAALASDADMAVAPQMAVLPLVLHALKGSPVGVAAQNCGQAASGAFTGETSPVTLKELGVSYVILGHSERRWVFHEPSSLVQARLLAALSAGLRPILCVGERLIDRKEGKTFSLIEEQLSGVEKLSPKQIADTTIAYEPVWAIGTGETATPTQAKEVHAFIRKWWSDRVSPEAAARLRILYGGSVKPDNSAALMAEDGINGLLVGGASLQPLPFAELIRNGVRSAL